MSIIRRHGLIAAALVLGTCAGVRADYVTNTLGSAGPGNYAILSIGTGNSDVALNGPGTTNGNVGVLSGTLSLASSTPPAVVGNVLLGNSASPNFSNANQVQGSVLTGQNPVLTQARTDALNASNTFASLSPTQSVPGGAITGTTTITAANPGGLNVVNLSNLNLGNGQSLTLSGPAGTQFVLNDSGGFTLNSGKINLAGGLTSSDVVLNVTGSGSDLSTSGGLNNESVVNGILLAPDRGVAFAPGLVNGEVIAGGNTIHFVSGSSVNSPPVPPVPEPASLVLLGLGVLGLGGLVRNSSRRKEEAPATA